MARTAKMVAQLPPTPCTQEMRDQVVAVADRDQVSVAAVQREALSLFLALRDRDSMAQSNKSHIHNREEQEA